MNDPSSFSSPPWWNDGHASNWDRVKEALRRDWEQTKADFTHAKKGHELHQSIGDTVKQATGNERIPPPNAPNLTTWDDAERAVRFGHGAAAHYENHAWNDDLEAKLRNDWDALRSGRTFLEVREAVRHGFLRARNGAS